MRFGSVCSGIEAASVAWQPLGWKAAWLAEIEPFPCSVLAHHYPDTPNLGDMTTIARRVLTGEVEAPDVFCGGTPCQAFSVAGLRQSLDDARGNLTLKFVEIADAIDHVRAGRGEDECIVFWENVPGVLSTKDNAFGCFLAGLAGEDDPLVAPGDKWANAGCVFGPSRTVAWRILDAQYFGVAQRRRRVFVVASARKGFDPVKVLFEFDGLRRDTAPSREAREVAPTIPSRSTAGGGLGADFDCDGGLIPSVSSTLLAQGNKTGGDRPPGTTVDTCGTLIPVPHAAISPALKARDHKGVSSDGDGDGAILIPMLAHTLRGEGFDASEDGTGHGTPLVPVCHDVTTPLGASTGGGNQGCVAAYGFQPRIARNGRGDMGDVVAALNAQSGETGKGDAAPCVAVAFTTEQTPKFNDNCALTLTKQSPTGGGQVQSVMTAMQVRRLTPGECESLQGFPNITETIRLEICFDLQKSVVSVAIQCRKSQSSVSTVGASESHQIASTADQSSSTCQANQEPLVALHVRQQSEGRTLELRSAQKLILSARNAEKQSASPLHTQAESFAAALVRIQQTLALTTSIGRAVSHPSILLSLTEVSGNQNAETSGDAKEEFANGVTPDAQKVKFTISSLGRVTVICDSPIATLLCSVMTATSGFIPSGILPENFSVELTTEAGYTAVPHRNKPAADGPRYKSLGNSWAVPNVRWIGERIQAVALINSAEAATNLIAELELA